MSEQDVHLYVAFMKAIAYCEAAHREDIGGWSFSIMLRSLSNAHVDRRADRIKAAIHPAGDTNGYAWINSEMSVVEFKRRVNTWVAGLSSVQPRAL